MNAGMNYLKCLIHFLIDYRIGKITMTDEFKNKFDQSTNWIDKVLIVSVFHNIQVLKNGSWKISNTALHFEISLGLCSENLRLAKEIDNGNDKIKNAKHREDALKMIDRRGYKENRKDYIHNERRKK